MGFKYNGAYYAYRKDAQGNIIAILDNTGNVVVRYIYDAWGNHVVKDGNGAVVTATTHIGQKNPFRYRGYYYDVETGLYYLKTRYYDPETGRFLNMDNVAYVDPATVNGLNLYSSNHNGMDYISNHIALFGHINSLFIEDREKVVATTSEKNYSIYHSRIFLDNYFDSDLLENFFAHNEQVFSVGAGIVEIIRKSKGLGQLESLSRISKALMGIGYALEVGISAYNTFTDESLSTQEKWASFTIDTIHTTGQTVGSYFLACIPYAGPFLSIGVPMTVDYFWSGEWNIFGFDIPVPKFEIEEKTLEEWVKDWVYSWFD